MKKLFFKKKKLKVYRTPKMHLKILPLENSVDFKAILTFYELSVS